jgi:spore coat polysaccharide biosynthesis predicted glycosyltransferase SpsG
MPLKILYRADGGHPVGTGHIFRAVRILKEISAHTDINALLMMAHDEKMIEVARSSPARLHLLPPRSDLTAIKPMLDAAPVLQELDLHEYDICIVDMLDTPSREMQAIAKTGIPLVTLDDRGGGRLNADAIINTLVEEPEKKILKPGCILLQGAPYAILDPIFSEIHETHHERKFGEVHNVLVTLGGADAAGLTVRACKALKKIDEIQSVRFVCGPAFPHMQQLTAELKSAPWAWELLQNLPNLVECYRWCDLAIIAGGLTMYEVCCTGTPSVAFCQPIDHQLELAQMLASQSAMVTMGYGLEAPLRVISDTITHLLHNSEKRRQMSLKGFDLVDGRGVQRASAALIALAQGKSFPE